MPSRIKGISAKLIEAARNDVDYDAESNWFAMTGDRWIMQ